jgi:hypothetical protein
MAGTNYLCFHILPNGEMCNRSEVDPLHEDPLHPDIEGCYHHRYVASFQEMMARMSWPRPTIPPMKAQKVEVVPGWDEIVAQIASLCSLREKVPGLAINKIDALILDRAIMLEKVLKGDV